MISRRTLFSSLGLLALGTAWPARASTLLINTTVGGLVDSAAEGLQPDATHDQSDILNRIIEKASARRVPVFLPPGSYRVANIILPESAHIIGVPGASRLVYAGDKCFLRGENHTRLTLSDLVIDGSNGQLGDSTDGLIHLSSIANLTLRNCDIMGAGKNAIYVESCGGQIIDNFVSNAAQAGIYAIESKDLTIRGNSVADCANGGILVHRWQKALDNTIVSGNRITRIGAVEGGTGEYGNGINLFRANNVMVMANHISDCAFSAIRANAASNIQITGNQCLGSGETAIYSEFGFEGAIVSDNLIDGAANGILIVNFDQGGRLATVTGNIIRNMRSDGPYVHDGAGFGFGIAAEADTVISGNLIENAPKFGLMLGWGPYLRNIVASGNIIRRTPVGCAVSVVEGVGDAIIADNLFQDVGQGAIAGYRWQDKVTGDLIAEGTDDFTRLTITGNRVA